jgi:putative heme-binding domain-containing protein
MRYQKVDRAVGHSVRIAVALAATVVGSADAQDHAGQYARADIEFGAQLYRSHCIGCHGENGDLMPQINLRDGRFPNASNDRALGDVIRNGLPGTAMTPTEYTDTEITALVAFVRNIANVDVGELEVGDADLGRVLYEGKGGCGSCHRIDGRGPRFAPDLSRIGVKRSAAALARSLLGAEGVAPINRPIRALLRDGTVINGRRLNEDTFSVQLIDDRERLLSFEKSELRELTVLEASIMPSYERTLTQSERADLVAYLLTLKGIDP